MNWEDACRRQQSWLCMHACGRRRRRGRRVARRWHLQPASISGGQGSTRASPRGNIGGHVKERPHRTIRQWTSSTFPRAQDRSGRWDRDWGAIRSRTGPRDRSCSDLLPGLAHKNASARDEPGGTGLHTRASPETINGKSCLEEWWRNVRIRSCQSELEGRTESRLAHTLRNAVLTSRLARCAPACIKTARIVFRRPGLHPFNCVRSPSEVTQRHAIAVLRRSASVFAHFPLSSSLTSLSLRAQPRISQRRHLHLRVEQRLFPPPCLPFVIHEVSHQVRV
jgi:hypothetical protein